MARAPRNQFRPADMFRSLAVILVPLLLIGAVLTVRLDDYPVQPVAVEPVLAQAREESPYPVAVPTALPAEWIPTRVTWLPRGEPGLNDVPSPGNRWTLGYLDPTQTYLAIEQSDGPVDTFLAEVTREGTPEASTPVSGEPWQQRVSPDGRTRSLVREAGEVTTVVTGDVGYDELAALAATLTTD